MARTTRQRTAVVEALRADAGFRSAQELHRLLTDDGQSVGLATVYRTLQGMADSGEVDLLRAPDGEVRYRMCERSTHHHHLVCRSCGRTEELGAHAVETWAAQIAAEHGFSDVEHTMELFGICATCRAAAS